MEKYRPHLAAKGQGNGASIWAAGHVAKSQAGLPHREGTGRCQGAIEGFVPPFP